MTGAMTNFDRLLAKPLFLCSFRSFFLAAALYGVAPLLVWLGFLAAGTGLPDVPGGPIVWHAHELMFGFGLAAVAGFVLTAVPEFTVTAAFGRRMTFALLLCWVAARAAFWLSGVLGGAGTVLAALLNSGFMAAIVVLVAPRLWRDPERRHLSFLWGLAAMWLVVSGYHADVLRGLYPMRWVLAGVGVMMVLIVVAMSRVSMRIVNDALDAERLRREAEHGDVGERPRLPGEEDDELPAYRARPSRRNLAVFGIAAYTLAEFALPGSPIAGWVALAAAAAVLNLLNDWHVGRALLTHWAFLLYAVYWLMALGYGAIGLSLLGVAVAPSAGLHLLTVGAMGLSIFGVLCIAGRTHSGYELDTRPWVPVAALAIGVGALARAAAGLPGMPVAGLQAASVVAWTLGFGLVAIFLGTVFLRPRPDAGTGCEEVMEEAA